jgi:hypothetical protein
MVKLFYGFVHCLSIVLIAFPLALFAQSPALPMDFESASTFYDFDGGNASIVANPQSSGINTSANVGRMIKNGGQTWGGTYVTLSAPIDFSVNKIFKMKVLMPRAGATVSFKAENGTDGSINYQKDVSGTLANTWEDLTFDLTGIDNTKQYQKIVLIFDNGTVGDGSANYTYYFDDIALPTMTQMNLPLSFDSRSVDYGVAGFGGASASSIVTESTAPFNRVMKIVKSGSAETWAGVTVTSVSGLTAAGFSSTIPFTESEKRINVRVFSPDAGITFRIKVENSDNSSVYAEADAVNTAANGWDTLTFTLTSAVPANNYNKLTLYPNFGVAGSAVGEKTYYFDDVKFGAAVILPVELTSFTASVAKNDVTLNWNTATEVNNYGFEVERAIDNGQLKMENWSKIGFVEGSGTTNAPKSYSFTDKSASGKTSYRLKQIDRDGKFEYSQTVEIIAATAPKEFTLQQNYPNPFNPTTSISYQLSTTGFTSLIVYDAIGREVATMVNAVKDAGSYTAQFDGTDLSGGVYFARLASGGETRTRKLVLLK